MKNYNTALKVFTFLIFFLLSSCGNKKNITLEFDFDNTVWSNKQSFVQKFQGEKK